MLLSNTYIYLLCLTSIILFHIRKLYGYKNLTMIDYWHINRTFNEPFKKWSSLNLFDEDKPFPDINIYFPNHIILKNNWEGIRDEAMNIYKTNRASKIIDDIYFTDIADKKWKKFYIKWYGPILEDAYKLCPITTKLIEQLPEVNIAMFSILEPGSKISPHSGLFKGCIRYHLGLNCPEGAFIIVDGIKYSWKNGENILFDDTYEHEVKNNSNDLRIILICDVDRKMKDDFSQKINKLVIDYLGPHTSRANN